MILDLGTPPFVTLLIPCLNWEIVFGKKYSLGVNYQDLERFVCFLKKGSVLPKALPKFIFYTAPS